MDNIPVTTEVYMYQINDFLADVGGYLGLLIGASVLTLVEYFISAAEFAKRKLGGGRSSENRKSHIATN